MKYIYWSKLFFSGSNVYDTVTTNGLILEEIGKKINGFKKIIRPTTKDNYIWFWGLSFKLAEGEIIILFPWAQDWKRQHYSQMDRSIAIYTTGTVSQQEIQTLLENFSTKLLKNSE